MSNSEKPKVKVASPQMIAATMATLRAWQRDRKGVHACPSCGAPGIEIIDRSTRPVADWYVFRCRTCGLDDVLNIPMTAHRPLL